MEKILRFCFFLLLVVLISGLAPDRAIQAANIDATIRITICGNDEKETGEQCDGIDLGGASCVSQGFGGGTLSCKPSCEFNTSACTTGGGGGGGSGGGGGFVYVLPVLSLTLEERARSMQIADFNGDGAINITDVSILLYYFGKDVGTNLASAPYDLNKDGTVNITDVSILLYYWR